MLIRLVVDFLLLEEIHQEFVIPLRRSHDVTFDAVIPGDFGCAGFDGDFADFGSNGVFGDIPERSRNRLHQLVQKCFGFIRPQRAASLYPVILPIELRFAVSLGKHFQKLAEHENLPMPISPSMTHPQKAMEFMNHDGGALDDK